MKTFRSFQTGYFYPLITIILIVALAWISILLTSPPKPKKHDSSAREFSAERAFKHIEHVAQWPHMTGTPEHDLVCNYLVNELERIGLEVDIQTTTIADYNGYYVYANVTNVVGRIRGSDNSKAVMVVGHYDTQPHTPGAADDGIAVGSMLEAAEIIKNHYSLKNDIIFLFTDAEEIGLIGAEAFAKEHPWMEDVGLVLNLEARGNKGAVLAFEVSPENGWIIREFAKGVERPFAASMMYEVYNMLPNNTDFTVFKSRGYSGFNLALVNGYVNYHSPTDTPANLSLASLQHMGSYVMSISKHFGNIPLYETKAKDLVYFNILGHKMIYYPASWSIWIFSIIVLLFILFLYMGFGRRHLGFGKILLSFLFTLLALAFTVGIVYLLNMQVKSIYPHYNMFYSSNFYNVEYYFLAFSAIAIAAFVLVFSFYLHKVNIFNVMVSVFFLFILISFLLLLKVPTASYILLIPLLLGLISINILLFLDIEKEKNPFAYHLILLIGLSPTILILSPYIDLLYNAFGLDLPIASASMLAILLLFALPFLEEALVKFKHKFSLLAFGLSLLFLIIAHTQSKPNNERPLQSNLVYALHNNMGKAFWLSRSHRTDSWNKQFFEDSRIEDASEFYPWREWTMLKADAEFMAFEKPLVEIAIDSTGTETRVVEFSVKSLIDPTVIDLVIPIDINVLSFSLDGITMDLSNSEYRNRIEYYHFRIFNPYFSGHIIKVEYEGNSPLPLKILEKKLGLPPFGFIKPMPTNVIENAGFESSITLVANEIEL
jgi:hypothetical protein